MLLFTSGALKAQTWSGIISASRATDWSRAGVEGGIPSATWTQCGSTIAAYTGTGQTIQTAINNCTANHYVQLGAGTFTLSWGFSLKSGVAVRGMGADQTFLIINNGSNSGTGNTCGYGFAFAIAMCASSGVSQSTANWTAGYAKGTTRITLSSTTGIAVGTVLLLDQLDETDGYPALGDSFLCEGAGSCSNQGGGASDIGGTGRSGRGGGTQTVKVTNVVGGGQFDISPPISLPNIRSGQSPGVLYANTITDILSNSGVENLSIDYSGISTGGNPVGIGLFNTVDCWVTGTRIAYSGSSINNNISMANTVFATISNNYFANGLYVVIESYPIQSVTVGGTLIENNICQGPSCDHISAGSIQNSVMAYNFTPGLHGPGYLHHGASEVMNLFEGNVTMGYAADITHGTSEFNTAFRNAMIGRKYGPTEVAIGNSIHLESHNRFYNVIGNVMGDTHYNTYETDSTSNNDAIYDLGWQGNNSGSQQSPDSNVARTLMRWGNWDSVTNATRWCGNSSDPGWSTTCASTSEVPSGIANFSNPVPASTTLPASFYYSSKPSWWPSAKPWPAIGPDVTGGNITNMAGHAYTTPAADCYLSVMGGASDGSGGPYTFNANTCYANSSGSRPAPPPTLTVTVH